MKKHILVLFSMLCFLFIGTACNHTHTFGNWQVNTPATYFEDGEERRYCQECGEYESRTINQMQATYIITAVINDTELLIGVGENGEYNIEQPTIEGYNFLGWKDSQGNDFDASGVISSNTTIYANLEVAPTTTFEQLKNRIELGINKILIADNITLTDTIYVYNNVEIYCNQNYTLTRDANFLGDLFVIGEDKLANNPILDNRTVKLTLKTYNDATLTFDGNKTNITKNVVGTAFYITNSSTLEMNNGVVITNFKKLGNERIINDFGSIWDSANYAGGAAVIVAYGTFDMYGGVISNNEVNLLDPDPNPDLAESDYASSYGGAIYNRSAFNMYGGTIEQNKAGRAGAIYNYRTLNLQQGNILNNTSSSYAGAIYLPNSQHATLRLGQENAESVVVNISNNTANSSGGAIFTQTLTNFIIYNGVKFEANSATGNGGAICSSGPVLATGATFVSNTATSKGGALYLYYRDEDNTVRYAEIKNCTFNTNSAEYGAAISLYSSNSDFKQGAIAEVDNCSFYKNTTTNNGGAVYVARYSQLTLKNSSFEENSTTATEYGGGAVYFTNSTGEISNTTFTKNSSTYNAGAIAIYSNSEVKLTNVSFAQNTASQSGGALYSSKSKIIESSSLTFSENTANIGGGLAVYSSSTINISGVTANKNESTENGGFLYISGSTVTLSKLADSQSLISLNKANDCGGAISIHSAGTLNLYGLTFDQNSATNYGGAINLKGATTNIGDAETFTGDNTFTSNSAKNGGAIYVETSSANNATFNAHKLVLTGNTASTNGGGLYIHSDNETIPTATINTLIASNNTATNNGGALYAYTLSIVTIKNLQATGNSSDNYGGFAYISGKANVTLENVTASTNSSPKGGFIYITTTATTLTILAGQISNNTADEGAFLYSNTAKTVIYIKGGEASTFVTYDENGIAGKYTILDIEE